jgi:Cytochrome P450
MRQRGTYGSPSNWSIYLSLFSTGVAWALYALGDNPAVNAKLNAEARAFYTDTPSMDELNEMTYLDYVTREVLRLYAPVTQTERVAKEDTVVPLSEPFIDRNGVKRHEFRQVVSLVRYCSGFVEWHIKGCERATYPLFRLCSFID